MLPRAFQVDFTPYRKDLVEQALSRILSQHYDKCVLRQFVAAFGDECQELYDACIDMQEMRTPFEAEGENLNALGRIVGEPRAPWVYDESGWTFFDRQGQGADQTLVWCIGGPMGVSVIVEDSQYQMNIIVKAIKNHTLTSSVPELQDLIDVAFDQFVSFEKTGPNEVKIIVPASISMPRLVALTRAQDNMRVDNEFYMNYPATLDISQVMMFAPGGFLIFDTEGRGVDQAPVAVGVTQIGA